MPACHYLKPNSYCKNHQNHAWGFIWLYENMSLIYSFPMILSPTITAPLSPVQAGAQTGKGETFTCWLFGRNKKECLCAMIQHFEHRYGEERITDSLFTGCIYRELPGARPPVFSEYHMRLLIQDVESRQMIKLSRQIPFSADIQENSWEVN